MIMSENPNLSTAQASSADVIDTHETLEDHRIKSEQERSGGALQVRLTSSCGSAE